MPFRASFKFVQQVRKLSGWSENFWCSSNNLPEAKTAANQLYTLLLRVHSLTSYVTHVELSEVGGFRQTELSETNATSNPESTGIADIPTTALQLRLRNAETKTYQTTQWIKGIPDAQINAGGFYVPTSGYAASMNALLGLLVTGPWGMRCQNKEVEKKRILSISQDGSVFCQDHGYVVGVQVRISRVHGLTNANGLWRIATVTANNFTLANWVIPNPAVPMYGDNMTVQKQEKIIVAIKAPGTQIVGATSHKVGRPFALAIGKQKHR